MFSLQSEYVYLSVSLAVCRYQYLRLPHIYTPYICGTTVFWDIWGRIYFCWNGIYWTTSTDNQKSSYIPSDIHVCNIVHSEIICIVKWKSKTQLQGIKTKQTSLANHPDLISSWQTAEDALHPYALGSGSAHIPSHLAL